MKYSTMEFDNETTFEEFTTTIDTLDLDKEKDLPALTCVDLFPDPPHLIATSNEPQQGGSLADDDEFAGFKLIDNKPDGINHPEVIDDDDDVCLTSETATVINQTENSKEGVVLSKIASPSSQQGSIKTPTTGINATASAPVSPASYFSSAESVSSAVSSSKKTKKRYCRECDVHFRKTRELHEHLKTHIKMPDVRLEKLSDNNEKVKEYLCSLSPKPSPTHGSLKLKLKLLSSQNFEVVPHEKEDKPAEIDSRVRILKAADIKCKSEAFENINAVPFAQNSGSKPPNSFLQPENRYFECPTFDGLDAFADDMNSGEATEDLLKKLLENNKEPQLFQKEPDWPANANEFISIDSLAPRCNVCHMNFSHPKYLYEHKQITGHDFHNRMAEPIPPTHSEFRHHQQNAYMQGTPPPPPQNLPPLYQMAQMRGNFPGYGPRLNVRHMMHHPPQPSPPPGFHPPQCMITRTPPPLYRVNGNPSNFPPNQYMDKRPEMYGPPPPQFQNGNQHLNPEMMRQPIFLKSRLQKAIRGRSQGLTNEVPTAPGILTQQTAIRPRFLGPNPQMAGQMQFQRARPISPPKQGEPPTKRVKVESAQNRFSASPSPSSSNGIVSPGISNSPGMPIIHSVHSGINASNFTQMNEKSKETSLNDQTSPTAKGTIKNPKDVANILATRGITVTHKGKSSLAPSLANKGTNSSNSSAQEAVQKLQANNSVSIISKKKPTDINVCKPGNPGSESGHRISAKFLSCPVITCKEKFLTLEGVNRHAFRWHGIPMPNPDRTQKRIIRCRLCHHTCSSQETLQDHVRREHEPSVNEIGIPIVDLRNEEVKRKLAGLGIFNYVPLTAAGASTSSLAFPVVSVQGAANPSICNLLGLGASSVLSLGPVKSITVRKANSENK